MSQLSIKSAVLTKLQAECGLPSSALAWANARFVPPIEDPWIKANVVFAQPEELTMGAGHYREIGFMQATLYYPLLEGDGPATLRAELIRKAFPKGSSVTKDGIVVHFNKVAQIMDGVPTDVNYIMIVRVPFYADIYS